MFSIKGKCVRWPDGLNNIMVMLRRCSNMDCIKNECFGLPETFDCCDCDYNRDEWINQYGHPCNEQHCWYGCTVCVYNHMDDYCAE